MKLGAKVEKGTILGAISAPLPPDETVLSAEVDGIVICVSHLPLVNGGETPYCIARFAKVSGAKEEIAEHKSNIVDDRRHGIETVLLLMPY